MRQKRYRCGNKIPLNNKLLENSHLLSIPATTNEEVATLRKPKSSTAFETLVKVPLFQSGIYGLLYGLPAGVALSIAVGGNSFIIISSTAFLVTGISWTKLSSFFNNLLVPFEEIMPHTENDEQQPIVNLEIIDRVNNTMTTGNIPAEVATTEQIIDFAKNVRRDVERRRRQDINLTQVRFTKFPNKIFSQPRWTEFIRILEGRKLVQRKNKDAPNSPYILTRTGLDFIYKYSELEL